LGLAEDRIQSLIASVSRAFPIGALMTLVYNPESAGMFARRPIEGAPPEAKNATPEQLLLDGQQRMTSLYRACLKQEVVETITPKNKLVKRWFYVDIQKALRADADREEAIFAMPEDRRLKTNFDRDILLDLSKPEYEYEKLMYPLTGSLIGTTGRIASTTTATVTEEQIVRLFSGNSRTRSSRISRVTTSRSYHWFAKHRMKRSVSCLKR